MHSLGEKDFDFLAARTEGYSGSDLSTLVNDGLMRPIKALQQVGYFRRVRKSEMKASIEEWKADYMMYSENLDGDSSNGDEPQHTDKPITMSGIGESNDGSMKSSSGSQGVDEQEKILKSSFWMPVETDGMSEEQIKKMLAEQMDIHKIDLPKIS